MAKKKLSVKGYAQLLFTENRVFLRNLQVTKDSPPLAIISIAALSVLRLLPLITKVALDKKKPQFFEKVLKEYERLLRKWYLGEDIALITTAVPLTEEEEEEVSEKLAAIFGRYLKLEIEVDPELIGGLAVKVGDKIIDRSVLGKLKKLEEHIRA